jgi:hypothetical protein
MPGLGRLPPGPGRGPAGPDCGRGMLPGVARPPPGACGRGPGRSWPPGLPPPGACPPGRGPWPGRGARCGRAMPVEPLVVKGLLPGRGPAGRPPGFGPPGLAPEDFGPSPAGFGPGLAPGAPGAPGAPEPPAPLGRGVVGAPPPGRGPEAAGLAGGVSPTGGVNSGTAGRGLAPGFGPACRGAPGLGAAPPGFSAPGLGVSAPGLGAAGLAALAPGLAGFLLPPVPLPALNASVSLRTTGASIVEDAERTNSPSSWSLAMTTLLSTPSSLASSYTRTLATSLLIRSGGRSSAGPSLLHGRTHRVLIECSSQSRPTSNSRGTYRTAFPCGASYGAAWPTTRRSSPVSSGPSARKARGNARRRTASSRQVCVGCTYAPRPGSTPR